jgi:dTDP-glucose 4,6-dehydratase
MRYFRHAVVTGGAGFLGSHLCDRLIANGTQVTCLDNFLTGAPENVAHLQSEERFRLVRTDVTDYLHVAGDVDLVLHFASPASPADYLRLPIETMKVGSIGTLHALGLAKDKGARFVLASTSEAYGDPQVHPQPEDYWGHVTRVGRGGVTAAAPRPPEALTTAYRTARGTDTAIVRIFNTYGPRMRAHDGRAIPTFLRQALDGEPLTVAGDGRQTRSVCYVDDTVSGVLAVAGSDLAGPVNVGCPEELTVLDIAQSIIEATGSRSDITFIARPVDDPMVRRPDISLIQRELGWQPRVSWRDGLTSTIAAMASSVAA